MSSEVTPRRIFVGIPMPEDFLELATHHQEPLTGVPGVQLTQPGDFHLTIIPPWEEKDPDAVARDMAAIDVRTFPMSMTGVGYGPHGKPVSLAWLTAHLSPELDRLWLQTWRALWSQDAPRGTFPHVTLAHFPEGSAVPELTFGKQVTGMVSRVCMYEVLGDKRYKVLASKDLG